MKKLILILLFVLIISPSFAQSQGKDSERVISDNTENNQAVTYRLFPTQNIWTFIKLNTRNGQMWQIQYDAKGNNRIETYLNTILLATKEEEVNGRFTLYPTQNIYTFILLDQLNGKVWQVQWAPEPANRLVIPIQ